MARRSDTNPEAPDETPPDAARPDLAMAIVQLGKAAQSRRHARRELLESTNIVAGAIRKQLRSGDNVDFDEWKQSYEEDEFPPDVAGLSFFPTTHEAKFPDAVFAVARVFDGKGVLQPVLTRSEPGNRDSNVWIILEDVDTHGSDPRALTSPDVPEATLRRANMRECALFSFEADRVIAAFAKELGWETELYASAAQRLTRVVVR